MIWGMLSPNGQWFIVDVTTPDGLHDSYPLNYRELKRTISICKSVWLDAVYNGFALFQWIK